MKTLYKVALGIAVTAIAVYSYKEATKIDTALRQQPGTFHCKTDQEFYNALSVQQPGDFIVIDSSMVLDTFNLKLAKGVTLTGNLNLNKSFKGNVIQCKRKMFDLSAFILMDSGCTVSNLVIKHLDQYGMYSDHSEINGINCGVKILKNGSNSKITGCIIQNFNKWNVWCESGNGNNISNNIIERSFMQGFGYGIWLTSANGTGNSASNNIVSSCAAGLDAGGHVSNLLISNNTFIHPFSGKFAGRHSNSFSDTIDAGTSYINNKFFGTGMNITTPYSRKSLTDISGNQTTMSEYSVKGTDTSSWCEVSRQKPNKFTGTTIYKNNRFNQNTKPQKATINIANGNVSISSTVPLMIRRPTDVYGTTYYGYSMNYAAAYGRSLLSYAQYNPITNECTNFDTVSIVYAPKDSMPRFTGWCFDSYNGSTKNKGFKFVVANTYDANKILTKSDTLWKNDLATLQGWQYINITLPSKTCKISCGFVLTDSISNTDIVELFVLFDDVYLFNCAKQISNGSFEAVSSTYKDGKIAYNTPQGSKTGISFSITTGYFRSGERAMQFRLPYLEGQSFYWKKATSSSVEFY